ncbi:MAG: hypothetical protein E7440_07400 [Ruminococcaceae bacterium]|nr:hypothetical protein [Oscillospiraceae bacterium]
MNNETLLIAPAPTPEKELGVIGSADTVTYIETKPADAESVIGGADGPTAILTTGVGVSENMTSAVEILGQGMASIFVVLGIIAVFVSLLKKLDNKKK